MSWPLHGSNPQYIYQFLNMPMPDEIIDFSVNLNPLGPPSRIKEKWSDWLPLIEDYPDPHGSALVERISHQEGLTNEQIILGNGGADIIRLLANMFSRQRVLLIQPTFAEYERMCRAYGCDISHFVLSEGEWRISLEALIPKLAKHDVVFLCHPNNPTGIVYPKSRLLEIIKACQINNCYLVIDEAFYDFTEEGSTLAPVVNDVEHVIIIRSLTKMFSLAGLRLGYGIAHPQMIEKLKTLQAHWNVNALALAAGEECFQADEYEAETRAFITKERKRVLATLRSAGWLTSNSQVNFFVLRDPELSDQLPLFKHLLRCGLVPRHTVNYRGLNGRWMRFAIRQKEENDLLLEGLSAWKNNR